jgi:hypothetical protein
MAEEEKGRSHEATKGRESDGATEGRNQGKSHEATKGKESHEATKGMQETRYCRG